VPPGPEDSACFVARRMRSLRAACVFSLGILGLLAPLFAVAADWPQWRGPDRNGLSAETGLLDTWTNSTPALV